MKNVKNQNSILVLATLGVYLGLVLVGATPQVLAQAAMTRQFNVKDETEIKDDVDKKPDNEEINGFLEKNLETAWSSLIESLRTLRNQGKFRAKGKKSFVLSTSHQWFSESVENAASGISVERPNDPNEWIMDTFLALHKSFEASDHWPIFIQVPAAVKAQDRHKYVCFDTEISNADFIIRLTFSREDPQNATLFAENLNQIFLKKATSRPDVLTKQIYDFTKAASEKNQVFIVTRLPRAGLASLLARDAK